MSEAITSFLENYKSKIRNPLIGTMISVWIIHNWKIVYSVFNFDDDCTMQDKINYIEVYFSEKNYWCEVWTVVWISFVVMIATYLLLALSRLLTNGYYKIVEPWIKKLVDKNEIFTIESKKKLEGEIEGLKAVISKLRDTITKTENINRGLVLQNEEIEKKHTNEIINLSESSKKANDSFELLEKSHIPANKVVNYFNDIINTLSPDMKNEIIKYINNRNGKSKKEYVNYVGLKIELQKKGIIIDINGETKTTDLGTLFLEYFKFVEENKLPF